MDRGRRRPCGALALRRLGTGDRRGAAAGERRHLPWRVRKEKETNDERPATHTDQTPDLRCHRPTTHPPRNDIIDPATSPYYAAARYVFDRVLAMNDGCVLIVVRPLAVIHPNDDHIPTPALPLSQPTQQRRPLPRARDLPGPRTPRRAGDRALLPQHSNRIKRHRPPHPRPRPRCCGRRRRADARGRRERLPAPPLPHAAPAGGLHALRPALGRGRPGLGDA